MARAPRQRINLAIREETSNVYDRSELFWEQFWFVNSHFSCFCNSNACKQKERFKLCFFFWEGRMIVWSEPDRDKPRARAPENAKLRDFDRKREHQFSAEEVFSFKEWGERVVSPATWLLNTGEEKVLLHCGGVKRIAMSFFLLHCFFWITLINRSWLGNFSVLYLTEPTKPVWCCN